MRIAFKKLLVATTILIIAFSLSHTMFAAENTFEVKLSLPQSGDFDAPSTPSALSATAVSTSEIDLSWNASTDNVGVAGYKIYRDSVYLTTVVGTTYPNIGLAENTSYTYTVSAIDSADNESALSNSATATTLSTTIPPVSPVVSGAISPIGGGFFNLDFKNLEVTPTAHGATLSWNSGAEAQSAISWGQTSDYEYGSGAETIFAGNHQFAITDLNPHTAYYFKIEMTDRAGRTKSYEGSFMTENGFEILPENVENVSATITGQKEITVSWQNPSATNFDSVRVVRSDKFYPVDIYDGKIVYEGNGQSFKDTDVSEGVTYYYTIFAKDKNGNYSSGSIIAVRVPKAGEAVPPPEKFNPTEASGVVDPLIKALSFADFSIIQDDILLPVQNGVVSIDGAKTVTISLSYIKLPEILKTIAITLTDPQDSSKSFTFLLKVNKDKTAYIATLGAFNKSGKYNVIIDVLDYKNQGLKKIDGALLANISLSSSRNGFVEILATIPDKWVEFVTGILFFASVGMYGRSKIKNGRNKLKQVEIG